MARENDDWFVNVFAKYSRSLRRYLRRFSVSDDTAADVAQEAFLRMYVASKIDNVSHPRAYLYQVARNLVLNHLRDTARAGTETVADFDDLGPYDDFPSLESASISRQEYELLIRAVEQLPPQCRRVFILRKIFQYSYREIVDELGISLSTVEKHVALGVKNCNRFLTEASAADTGASSGDKVVSMRKRGDG